MTTLDPLRARVDGGLVLLDVPERPLVRLVDAFALPNPKYTRAKRMGRWTGGEAKTIEAGIVMPDRSLHLPRGAVSKARTVLARYGYGIRVETDARTLGAPLGAGLPRVDLRDYQSDAIAALVKHTQGLVVLPCGCGKSRLGIGAIARIGLKALVMVDSRDLADQWDAAIREHLGMVPGWIGAGRAETSSPIVIGIIDSLVPLLERSPEYGQRFGFVILDEAHGAPALSVRRALDLLPARYRLGLTATPYREDGLDLLIDWSFGDRLLERNTIEMVRAGFLMQSTLECIETGYRFEWDGADDDPKKIVALEKDLTEDIGRNAFIVQRVIDEVEAGETVLVLTGRKDHVSELSGWLKEKGIRAQGVTSLTAKKKRKGALDDFRAGSLDVLVATSLADQGLDIPRLSRVAIAFPSKARGPNVQRMGRLLRNFVGKQPRILDFVDMRVPTLTRRAAERKRAWKKEGVIELEAGT